MKRLLVAMAMLAAAPAMAQSNEFGNGREYLKRCERPEGDWRDICSAYLFGLNDMLVASKLVFRAEINACPPPGVTLEQTGRLLAVYLQRKLKDGQNPNTAASYVLALSEAHPCVSVGPRQSLPPSDRKM